jgi:hypothetical protein
VEKRVEMENSAGEHTRSGNEFFEIILENLKDI